jgi:hypothetical protein
MFMIEVGSAQVIKNVTGTEARNLMEALSASGFQIENNADEWSGKTLIIKTDAISCHYNAISPDEWMTNVTCNVGTQSLALAKSIKAYVYIEAGVGNRWFAVNSINCALKYVQREYSCQISTEN